MICCLFVLVFLSFFFFFFLFLDIFDVGKTHSRAHFGCFFAEGCLYCAACVGTVNYEIRGGGRGWEQVLGGDFARLALTCIVLLSGKRVLLFVPFFFFFEAPVSLWRQTCVRHAQQQQKKKRGESNWLVRSLRPR